MKDEILKKLTSGRYYLTVIGGLVFAYTVHKKILPDAATASILTAIFMSYFNKDKEN